MNKTECENCKRVMEVNVKNLLGDRKLHRWRKGNLKELLEDYEEV